MGKSQGICGGHLISWDSSKINEITLAKIAKFSSFGFYSWSSLRNAKIRVVSNSEFITSGKNDSVKSYGEMSVKDDVIERVGSNWQVVLTDFFTWSNVGRNLSSIT